jgi:hypothetical protein
MSRIPPHIPDSARHDADDAPTGWPTALDREAFRLARQLTPAQRHLLVRAGLPRWMRISTPWHPAPGRETAEARALASRAFGILEPLPHDRGAYRLTQLGELVASIASLNVLTFS